MDKMVTVEEAIKILTERPISLEAEEIGFESSFGRVLAEPIYADRDFPPFNRVAMDGYALQHLRVQGGQSTFLIEHTVSAGDAHYRLIDGSACVEIMTGAVLPEGCDTVVPYEETELQGSSMVLKDTLLAFKNVHHQGSDREAGAIIVPQYSSIGAPEIGIAATVGATALKVYRVPSICIVSTGDELVPVGGKPAPHQIRSSNVYALKASLSSYPCQFEHRHLPDDQTLVNQAVVDLLKEFQIVIFIGGSSMGKKDFLPSALSKAGLQEHFYKIKQRPGKPFWFGSSNNHFAFALPGNPVSCFLCLEKYFKFWLNNSLGKTKKVESAQLSQNFNFPPDLTYFLQVKTESKNGVVIAHPVTGGGSGDHANLAEVDAFLQLPGDRQIFNQGESFELLRFRK
ncbi:MAG: molybdopterin molybdotransferase MoeA [Saprospiraceae bacterium]|nr:molybdopterin molybdotransferase MoeA [Saprospiraceae bacterium]